LTCQVSAFISTDRSLANLAPRAVRCRQGCSLVEHEPKSLQKDCPLRDCRNLPSACARCTAFCCRAEANTGGRGCGPVGIFLASNAARHGQVGCRTHNHDCGYAQSRLSYLCGTPNWARKPILVCTAIEIARKFGLRSLVCTIIENNPGQLLPQQCIFKEP